MEWCAPKELPDLRRVGIVALDTETRDDRLRSELGSGWPFRQGHICGVSVAYRADNNTRGLYFPIRHPDSENFDATGVYGWLNDHIAAGVRFVTQNGLYDWGWLRAEAGIEMPPSDQIEEIGALATMVDENRFRYSLDALCAWRGLPGKDDALLRQGISALALVENKRRKVVPQRHVWQLPARYVGPYAEADAANTLALFESLDPVIDKEGTRAAYRLECDLLPMVLEMRLRGIRVDLDAAARAHDLLLSKRNAALADLSREIGCAVSMHELQGRKWLIEAFERHAVPFPRTNKGNPSFSGGKLGWMAGHAHWLPRLIAVASKYNKAADGFLQAHIIKHVVNGRLHAEINPHRSEEGGTKSSRFSYSDPPLQQMPSRDPELAPLIRGVFLPEDGEVWAKPDASQQEFRFVVHYANQHQLRRAAEAVARYRDDPNADFHAVAATLTGLDRTSAKQVNFAKIYGAGVAKFAAMVNKPIEEAQRLYAQYDRELPFLSELSKACGRRADSGHIELYDGARRHFNRFAPPGKWSKGAGPCEIDEAHARVRDPGHPWYRQTLQRADRHTALNALIQGSAARHTKRWMRAVWREGIVPLLQMHDCLDCSVGSREQAEMVARLGEEAVQLDVPMRVDLKYGRTWGDASHSWEELNGDAPRIAATVSTIVIPESPAGSAAAEKDEPMLNRDPPTRVGAYPHGEDTDGPTEEVFIYRDAGGKPYLKVEKRQANSKRGKQYPQWHWTGSAWVLGKPKGPKIPYRLPELIAAPLDAVHIAEGEKDAETLAALGLIATTNSEGAKKGSWASELNPWFVGRKRVFIPEDNDDAGRKFAREKAKALEGIVPDIRIVSFPDVPEGEDVTYWLRQLGHSAAEYLTRCEASPQWAPPLETVCAADVAMNAVAWWWPNRFALGKVGIIAGLPDEGKGQLFALAAARITTGGLWPCNEGRAPLGSVVYLQSEDGVGDTVVPRLVAAGADLARVHFVKLVEEQGKKRMLSLRDDLERLRKLIVAIGDVRLVLIDPVSAYMSGAATGGRIDTFRAGDVRAVLGPVSELAEELNIGVLGIMHFNKKADITNIVLRISDSLAFGAAARHVYAAIDDKENDRKLLVRGKNNLARRDTCGTLAYRFNDKHVGDDPKTKEPIRAPFVEFDDAYVDITASEAMRAVSDFNSPGTGERARTLLRDMLAGGKPMPESMFRDMAKEEDISWSTMKNVKRKLRIRSVRSETLGIEGKGHWLWQWPEDMSGPA